MDWRCWGKSVCFYSMSHKVKLAIWAEVSDWNHQPCTINMLQVSLRHSRCSLSLTCLNSELPSSEVPLDVTVTCPYQQFLERRLPLSGCHSRTVFSLGDITWHLWEFTGETCQGKTTPVLSEYNFFLFLFLLYIQSIYSIFSVSSQHGPSGTKKACVGFKPLFNLS